MDQRRARPGVRSVRRLIARWGADGAALRAGVTPGTVRRWSRQGPSKAGRERVERAVRRLKKPLKKKRPKKAPLSRKPAKKPRRQGVGALSRLLRDHGLVGGARLLGVTRGTLNRWRREGVPESRLDALKRVAPVAKPRPPGRRRPKPRKPPRRPETHPSRVMVQLGVRILDQASNYPVFSTNQPAFTHYHRSNRFGLAQSRLQGLRDMLGKGTDETPNQIILRLSGEAGFDRRQMSEILELAKERLAEDGFGSKARLARNSDRTLDGELRVETDGNYEDAFLALGDAVELPADTPRKKAAKKAAKKG